MAEGLEQPLLGHAQEDALWDRAEAATAGRTPKPAPTVAQLLAEHPSQVVRFLQDQGVVKLGEMELEVRGRGQQQQETHVALRLSGLVGNLGLEL